MEASAKIYGPNSENQAMMAQWALPEIQANIRRYGWQSMVTRLTAITLASLFMLFGYASWLVFPASFRFWPVVCLFLLWIIDGHLKSLQQKYVDLYHEVVGGACSDLSSVRVDDHFNVLALWRPMVMLPYVVLIGLIALANLGF